MSGPFPDGVPQDGATLSVVVPVRDRQDPATRLVAALAAQAAGRPGAVELIVVDDASTPPFTLSGAGAILPARLIRSDRRLGANGARLLGLSESSAPFVHFHDSDDGVAPGWLDALLDACATAAATGAGVIVTRRLDETGGRRIPVAQDWWERNAARPDRVRRALALINALGPLGGVTFARAALAGARFPTMASSQDWALYREVYAVAASGGGPLGLAAPAARFIYRRDGADRISASARRKALGAAALDRGWARGAAPDMAPDLARMALRLWRLHQFRAHLAACRRAALDRILARTRLTRRLVWLGGALWLGLALGRW